MHQTILVHADVHERPEGYDVRDHPFEYHARQQVRRLLNVVPESGRLERGAWIAARLLELRHNVTQRGHADVVAHVLGQLDRVDQRFVANQ